MWLMESAGIARVERLSDDALAVLVDEAMAFLQGGGVVTPLEWQSSRPETKQALTEAGRLLRIEAAVTAATCGEDAINAAAVYAEVDGGEMFLAQACSRAADKAALKFFPKRFPERRSG